MTRDPFRLTRSLRDLTLRDLAPAALSAAGVAALAYAMSGGGAAVLGALGVLVGAWAGHSLAGSSSRPALADPEPRDDDTRRLRDLIRVVELPAFVLAPDNTILAANDGALGLFPEIREGRPLHQVTRHPALLEAVARARQDRQPQTREIAGRAPIQRRLVGSVALLPSPDEGMDAANLILQFRDLTEQDRITQLRTDFVANASHELRTPLASIKGFVETLQGAASKDAAAREKFLGIMHAQTVRMSRILDDLLSLSRIEMREHILPADLVDVVALLRATVDGLEPLAREGMITLRYAPDAETALVRGDRDELVQLFQNLIQNAIKYGPSGGHVDVGLSTHAGSGDAPARIVVQVRDDGPGIAEEHLPRLTERFYRVDTAASRERGGTGLGLAIVKHIVNRHRGELRIQSVLGQGSTFSVLLDSALPARTPRPGTTSGA